MSAGPTAKVPDPITLENRGESWKQFRREWKFYEIATKISKEEDDIRIAALMNVIGREGIAICSTRSSGRRTKIRTRSKTCCASLTLTVYPVPTKRTRRDKFFSRSQNAGETVEAYITALYKLSSTCNFGTMTDRLIKDRLVIGIRDDKVREKLLAKEQFDLETCIDTLKMLQLTHAYAQDINTDVTTHTVKYKSAHNKSTTNNPRRGQSTKYKRHALSQHGDDRSPCTSCGGSHPVGSCPARGAACRDCPSRAATCRACGRSHSADQCSARGAICRTCGKANHYAKMCRNKPAHYIDDEAVIHTVGSERKTKAHVTLTINDNADVSFHMDTGSSVDILPYDDYVRATDDSQCEKLEKTNIRLVMHNKSVVKPMGLAHLQVHRKNAQRQMRFVVVRDKVVPLLSLQSCLDLDLIKINDCDAINAVVMQTHEHNRDIGNGSKHTKETTKPKPEVPRPKPEVTRLKPDVTRSKPEVTRLKPEVTRSKPEVTRPKPEMTRSKPEVTKPKPEVASKPMVLQDPLLRDYTDVFEGLGCLAGNYRIEIDPTVKPVVHPPRRVPCALREDVKDELTRMVGDGIIAPVTEPTRWVSSMIAVRKKNNKLRICLDPRDLNKAIQRSHYPLPTLEDVATRLNKAKVFSVLDAKSGFWQVKLDEDSSYLTTFNTPFGRYRWLRMPFGINSAPEEWQRRAHELAEGLDGVEVVADDFLCIGFGATVEEATRDHDVNMRALLERARVCHLVLNPDKVKLRSKSVPFIGHILTDEGLKVDESKVEAIMKMPAPTDIAALKRILGMVGYLAKFLPHLSDVCEPLRQLDRKDVEWCWLEQHQDALTKIRELITAAPVLAYYDVKREVTIQCDASQSGLGAVLLQEGRPVCYASRALTTTEENYAQIEKELLAIVFSCEKFDQYVYGRHITVQSDHKPLEIITKKSMIDAPKRLQRMLLRLQKYDIDVVYTRGKEMHIADALSRAYLPYCHTHDTGDHVLAVELQEMDLTEDVRMSANGLQEIIDKSLEDEEIKTAVRYTLQGWPDHRQAVDPLARPYFNCRDELSTQSGALFKGQRIVIPCEMRAMLIKKLHSSHLGVEGCLRRAREVMYWPGMNQEVKDVVSVCSTCNAYRPEQCKEPLLPHDIPSRPWSRVGIDLFQLYDQHYLVTVDYFSNFVEVDKLSTTSATQVTTKLRIHFARYGVPDVVVSDNGPQFACEEFKQFATR